MSYTRPEVLDGYTVKLNAPCGSVFVVFNHGDTLREVGIIQGKSGSCTNLMLRVISLLVSKLLQTGLIREEVREIIEKQFEGNCGQNRIWFGGTGYHSCIDFIFKKIVEDMANRGEIKIEEEVTQQTEE